MSMDTPIRINMDCPSRFSMYFNINLLRIVIPMFADLVGNAVLSVPRKESHRNAEDGVPSKAMTEQSIGIYCMFPWLPSGSRGSLSKNAFLTDW